jgi:hypothetical protein
MEMKVMINKELVFRAVGLFYITEEMVGMDPSDDRLGGLYEMECEIFSLLEKMSLDEIKVYEKLIHPVVSEIKLESLINK